MRSIVRSIYEHSLETPDKNAIIATDCTVSYRMLWSMITGVSALLKRRGVQKGDRVILEAGPTVEYLACCYGIHLAGAVHVPVEKDVPEDRIREIAAEIQPSLILSGKHPLEQLDTTLDTLAGDADGDYEFPKEDMLQEILFTTGTTGKSKGVMITHYGQMNMCQSQNTVLNYSPDNVWMIPTPMNHAAGLRKTHMSMVRGSSVLLMDGFRNLKLFFDNMRIYHVTSLYLPPSAVHYILMLAGKELAKFDEQLDFLYSSSSALPGGDKEKLIELLPHVRKFDAYGGSEVGAVVYIDYNAVRGDGRCVGKPNPGVELFIVDENYQPVHATEQKPGIIAIRSNTVTAGYWNEPELTARTIQNGVIYMTDLGYIDEDGYLYLVGRRDDVINVGGLKVAPTEVEDMAQRFEKVDECACVPYEDKIFGRCLRMFVVMRPGYDFDAAEISDYLGTKLEAYKVPKYIERIDEIPKTYNGKIDRKRLIAMQQ
ncbi:MAG: acyl--CoA ligase [Ruminococcaceae bacterium]|jgi:acyl-coenzyme A synthetase/AMP-(fatty) acid ligase|nr:acyl--CoA ligase [Oscillospiraceae bacterium]